LFYLFPIFSMNLVCPKAILSPLLYCYLLRSAFHSGKSNLVVRTMMLFAFYILPSFSQRLFQRGAKLRRVFKTAKVF
jgi:hypothetical protein